MKLNIPNLKHHLFPAAVAFLFFGCSQALAGVNLNTSPSDTCTSGTGDNECEKPEEACKEDGVGPDVEHPEGNETLTGDETSTGSEMPWAGDPSGLPGGSGPAYSPNVNFCGITPHHNPIPNEGLTTPKSLNSDLPQRTAVKKIETDSGKLPTGVKREINITNALGEPVTYRQLDGVTICPPAGDHTGRPARLELVDDNNNPEPLSPTGCFLYPGDGSFTKYPLQVNVEPSTVGKSGRDMKLERLEFLVDQTSGAYEQIKMDVGLIDIELIDDFSYQIKFYHESNAGSLDPVTGRYATQGDPYRVIINELPDRDYNSYDFIRVIDTHGSYENIKEFRYVPAAEQWARTTGISRIAGGFDGNGQPLPDTFDGGQLTEQIIVNNRTINRVSPVTGNSISTKERIITTETWDENDNLVSRDTERQWYLPHKAWAVVEEVKDTDGFALTTQHTFYEDTADQGSLGKIQQTIRPDGSWTRYTYDQSGRIVSKISPWKDAAVGATASQCREIVYAYAPVDSGDSIKGFDSRPRTTIEYIKGDEVSRTYAAYLAVGSATEEYTEIIERTTVQGAAYEAPSNLRTVRQYYAASESEVLSGRLKRITRPDGTVQLHSYREELQTLIQEDLEELEGAKGWGPVLVLVQTIDELAAGDVPVEGKSIRREVTRDPHSNAIREEFFIYKDAAWSSSPFRVAEQVFSQEITVKGPQLLQRRIDGRVVLDQDWFGPLVVSMTNAQGTAYDYIYDASDELIIETKFDPSGSVVLTTNYLREDGGIGCGCDGSVEIRRGGMRSYQKTDTADRRSEVMDENGYITKYAYVDDRRIITETLPSGATCITEKQLDGRIKSITGTGVIPQYYTYTVNPGGTQTTRIEIASEGSPRYREMTYDVAGRMIREESPNSTGGTVVRTMHYNDFGLLIRQTEEGRADTLFEYDSLANLVLTGLNVDAEATPETAKLEPNSNDRITATDTIFQLVGQDWFEVTTIKVYPTLGDPTAVEVSETRMRKSGFASNADANLGELTIEVITTDIHGNSTIRRSYIDRATETVTQLTDTPFSDNQAHVTEDSHIWDVKSVTINGLLEEANTPTVVEPTEYDFDHVGRLFSVKEPRHTVATSMTYRSQFNGETYVPPPPPAVDALNPELGSTRMVETVTDGAGNETLMRYYDQGEQGAGQLKSVTDALGQLSYREYDILGRQVHTWGETDYPQAYSYNTYGELATLTTWRDTTGAIDFSTATWPSPTGGDETEWTYDAATGLLTRKEYADGNGTDYTYDSANRLAVRTLARDADPDTAGHQHLDTTYGYDSATGELRTVDYEDANTTDITYTYDRLGRQATVTDATGERKFDYDSATLQLTAENLDIQDSDFYNSMKLVRIYEDGTETNGLDGRLKGYDLLSGGQTSVSAATYGYESTGRLSTVTDGTDTFTYTYKDKSNLLASLSSPVHITNYTYAYEDIPQVPPQQPIASDDQRDLMTIIDNQLLGGSSSVSTYTYGHDALGRRLSRSQSGSASSLAVANSAVEEFTYNPRSEVTKSEVTSADNLALFAGFTYNPEYGFDSSSQEVEGFDAIGNRQGETRDVNGVKTYVADSTNQYDSVGGVTFEYDGDGNLTDNGIWTYGWNNENRLVEANNYGRDETASPADLPDAEGEIWLSMTYDYQGRLVEKHVRKYDGGAFSETTERYVYDGWNRIATFDVSNLPTFTLATRYLWGMDLSGFMQGAGGVGGLLKEGDNYPLYDANGNIMQKLDGTGAVVMSVDYDPFGNIIDGVLVGEYGFSTKPLIADLNWYYYGFRYYDPQTGRWPSRDPIEEQGGLNLYGFVGNDAIGSYDNLGLFPVPWLDVPDWITDLINDLIERVDVLSGIPLPRAPVGRGEEADWGQMMLDWFLENGDNPATYGIDSAHSKDIGNSYSIQEEILPEFCNNQQVPTGWSFTGGGTREGTYGAVEWFIGSYGITDWQESGADITFTVTNTSSWRSGTRLPASWTNFIRNRTGYEITELVTSADRGEVLETKIRNRFGRGDVPLVVKTLRSFLLVG